jgi:ornithine cyclodeaminase
VIVLGRQEVAAVLDPEALIAAVEAAFLDLSAGRASMPPRIASSAPDGLLGAMVAYLPSLDVLAAKLVSVFPHNVGVPTHQALVAVFDPRSGTPLALLDGEEITAQRTAAASTIATRLLARPDAETLAIVGTGVLAAAHARYLGAARRFRRVLLAGRDAAKVKRLAAGIGAEARGIEDAVRAADVICATTAARDPVIRREWLRPGAHLNSVGFNPQGQELDSVAGALVAVEARASAFAAPPAGANELRKVAAAEAVELGELLCGARSGRTSEAQVTIYKSVGVAAEDAAAAALVVRRAGERGLGVTVRI